MIRDTGYAQAKPSIFSSPAVRLKSWKVLLLHFINKHSLLELTPQIPSSLPEIFIFAEIKE